MSHCCSGLDGRKRVLPFKLKIKINITEEKRAKLHSAALLMVAAADGGFSLSWLLVERFLLRMEVKERGAFLLSWCSWSAAQQPHAPTHRKVMMRQKEGKKTAREREGGDAPEVEQSRAEQSHPSALCTFPTRVLGLGEHSVCVSAILLFVVIIRCVSSPPTTGY